MLTETQIRGVLDLVVAASTTQRDALGHFYLAQAGPELPAYLAEYVAAQSRADVRVDLLRFASPFASTDERVVDLAVRALEDRSGKVRRQALWLLAQSGRADALAMLDAWEPPTADDARWRDSAMRAIAQHDVQEWVRGTAYSSVVPWQFTRHAAGSAEFAAEIDHYIVGLAPTLVPALERVLGDVHLGKT